MLTPSLVIAKKRDGGELTREEVEWFISRFASGEIPDYQMSALAMAIYIRGMSTEEIAALTDAMLASGVTLAWPTLKGKIVDKHSTGGIGDKTSLILAPLLATCGLYVPMISGRGLGATGGTLDKLESIPGFRTNLSLTEIQEITARVGCVITGASADIAPADRKLYALRDVTATVPSIPLITASIMSKKLAAGLDRLVLDVKYGSGAFMKSLDDARALARSLVDTGKRMNVTTTALLTDMNQPLGSFAGNAVEVWECIEAMRGRCATDLWQVTAELGAELVVGAGIAADLESALELFAEKVSSGAVLMKFFEMVAEQGGDIDAFGELMEAKFGIGGESDSEHWPTLQGGHVIEAQSAGFVQSIHTEKLGLAIIEKGGGRKVQTDRLDHWTGIEMLCRIGDEVREGQPIVRVFSSDDQLIRVAPMIQHAITFSHEPVESPPLIVERVE